MPNGIKPGYYTDHSSYASGRATVNLKWVSQAAGALPAVGFPGTKAGGWLQAGGGAVSTVVHGGAGIFTITLNDAWSDLLSWKLNCKQAAAFSAAGVCDVQITADNSAVTGTQTIVILCTNAAGAAVEPAVNDVLALEFDLQSYDAN